MISRYLLTFISFDNLVRQVNQVILSPFYSMKRLKGLPKVTWDLWGLVLIL